MKVLGTTDSGYILQATKDEAANLMGFHSHYKLKDYCIVLKPGDEINVSELFQRFYKLQQLDKNFEEASRNCKIIAASLDLVAPVVHEIQEKISDIEIE